MTLIFLFPGILLVLFGFMMMLFQFSSCFWPSVPGIVIESYVEAKGKGSGRTVYWPRIRYEYQLKSDRYESHFIMRGERRSYYYEKQAQAVCNRFPAGKPVEVFYHSRQPKQSCLVVGVSRNAFILLFVGILCCAVGFSDYWL